MTATAPSAGDRAILYTEGCTPCPATVTAVADGLISEVRPGGTWLVSGPDQFVVEGRPASDSQCSMVLWDMGDPDPGAVPLDERVALLRRVGNIMRGDWSMTMFDGRDVKWWITTALDGDPAALRELGEDLRAIEED